MSNVVKAGRGPSHFRAAIHLTCACAFLGGCSVSSDRFSSWSVDSGYEPGPARNSTPQPQPSAASYPARPVQQVIAQPQPQSGFQLASGNPSQNAGYMQVSRVDLPPLPQGQSASGTKMADGYGPYNPPPVTDGTYTGPRVYTPYDAPANGAPPPPQGYYGQSGTAPVYPKSDARIYEPQPAPAYRDQPHYGAPADRDVYPPQPAWREGGDGEVVRVRPGDTLYSIARRFGVTVDMIARANNLSTVYVRPGTELFIPRAGPASYGRSPAGGPALQPAACAAKHCHVVKPGETVASLARVYGVTGKQIAEANNLVNGTVKAGQTIAIPAPGQSRQEFASAGPADRQAPPAGQGFKTPAPGLSGASPQPQNPAPAPGGPAKPAPEIKTAELTPLAEPQCDAALANPLPRMGNTFRKPVEGKTIAQFGQQRDGTVNEGVTISVPKGTPIKAAENGIVAYVGDELPGFGNLILIRHADEYVTAYAHADTVLVKKCDVVKRGQTVATAGTTGDASQPELHFEIRKNSKPVDPGPLMGS
jgi:murein DD-endopeptidase MepM/ murein hydrolase activator NlpD